MVGKVVVAIVAVMDTPPIADRAICFGSNGVDPEGHDSISSKMGLPVIKYDWMVPISVWIDPIGTFVPKRATTRIRTNCGPPFPI